MFIGATTLCAYASFLFGWHVHEKAILLVIIPFSLLALKDRRFLSAFRPLAVAGHVSLFPLLFTAAEFPIKIFYTVAWLITFLLAFDRLAPAYVLTNLVNDDDDDDHDGADSHTIRSAQPRIFLLDRFSLLYIAVAIPLMIYCSVVHGLVFGARYEFLPLMFISAYSALGIVSSWVGFLVVYLTS